jgi:hypothetical protein
MDDTYRGLILEENDELINRMNAVMNNFIQHNDDLVDEQLSLYCMHKEERRKRVDALVEVAKICGVLDHLYADPSGHSEYDD